MSEDWKSWPNRQRIIQQIDEHLRQTPEAVKKSAQELENSLFMRSSKKEEYLQYVSRIIMFLKGEVHSNNQNNSNLTAMLSGQQGNNPVQSSIGQGVTASQITLVNAGSNQMGHGIQPQMTIGGAGGSQMSHGNSSGGQITHVSIQGGQPAGMVPGQMVAGPNRIPSQMAGNITNQSDMNNWQTQQSKVRHNPNEMIRIANMNPKHPGMTTSIGSQIGKMGAHPMQMSAQNEQVTSMTVGGQVPRQGVTMQPRVPSPSFSMGAISHPCQGPPTPTGASPASQQHGVTHNLTFISPSPSSNTAQSPVGNAGNRGMTQMGVPSPGSAMINTPGQPQQQSPASNTGSLEERAYMEKVKQLQHRYLDTLREVAQKFGNSDTESAIKVRNLLEVIENPHRRTTNGMEVLRRCELVLERLGIQKHEQRGEGDGTKTKDNPVTLLFEGINLAYKSHFGYHTIHRTLSPALKTLLGPDLEPSIPKKRKSTDQGSTVVDTTIISEIIQGEVARLPPRFKLNLDGHHQSGGDDLTLICQLDDPNLPCVPPITLVVPPSYPNAPPRCKLSKVDYDTTPFLKKIHEIMTNRMFHVPEVCTLTMLLDAWEMSVRRACSIKPFVSDAINPLINLPILS